MSRTRYLSLAALALTPLVACGTPVPDAIRTPGTPEFLTAGTHDGLGEIAYFNGQVYNWAFPSQFGKDPLEMTFACFKIGLAMPPSVTPRATDSLFSVFADGATQHHCPPGSDLPASEEAGLVHDHIISAVPGSPGWSPDWLSFTVTPGPNFDPSIMPLTSIAAIKAAAADGEVIISQDMIDDAHPFTLHATVLGPAIQ